MRWSNRQFIFAWFDHFYLIFYSSPRSRLRLSKLSRGLFLFRPFWFSTRIAQPWCCIPVILYAQILSLDSSQVCNKKGMFAIGSPAVIVKYSIFLTKEFLKHGTEHSNRNRQTSLPGKTSFHIRLINIQTICQKGYDTLNAIGIVFIDFVSLWYGMFIQ